jgi:hypothetical protein
MINSSKGKDGYEKRMAMKITVMLYANIRSMIVKIVKTHERGALA